MSKVGQAGKRAVHNVSALTILGAGLLFALSSAHAANTTWTGASGSWNTPGSWSAGLPTTSGSTEINNGAVVSVGEGVSGSYDRLFVGNIDGGAGAIELAGGQLSGGLTYLGDNAAGSGNATVTSGTWTHTFDLYVGNGGQGVLGMSGGAISSRAGYIGYLAGSNGSASITGGTWTMTNALIIGYSGTGSFGLNGGIISAGNNSAIGSTNTGVGTATITSGTLGVTNFTVGDAGKGTLTINGGLVNASSNFIIGSKVTGEGKVIVSSGTLNSTSQIFVGGGSVDHKASLEVSGGRVATTSNITVASGTSSLGEVTVTSGTLSASTLTVGLSGTASMSVSGGVVSATNSIIGSGTTGNANVTLNGGTWNTTRSMNVGASGTATIAVEGGVLTTGTLNVGANTTGHGTVTVSSGTAIVNSTVAIGVDGSGTVDISGGLVNAKTVTVASGTSDTAFGTGTLRLSGSEGSRGILATESIGKATNSTGTASVVFDGGIVRAKVQQASFISNFDDGELVIEDGGAIIDSNGFNIGITSSLSGTGGLTKQGTGALTLSASNSYSGGTVIEAGTVVAGANHALGTGGVTIKSGTLSIQSGVEFTNTVTLEGGSFGRGIGSGASLANAVDLTSSIGGVTTAAKIVDGISSTQATLQGSFSASSLAINDELRTGDVLHLSGVSVIDLGTGKTDTFVLQIQVANLEAGNILGWLNSETNLWVNAVDGNIGGLATFFDRGYDAETDFVLGNYGIDVENGIVWAVLNHNSDFAVIPEPGTWALLLFGGAAFVGWRKRRSGGVS